METVQNILKEVYEDRLRDQLQSELITIKRVEQTSEGVSQDVGGKYTTFPIRVRRNQGIGARGEFEGLPTPRTQGYEAARVNLKYLYGALMLTGQTFELASTNRQAFASSLDQEVNGLREGVKKDINRQVYGNNRGVLATATAGGSTTTFVTDNVQYLEIGMFVDMYDQTDTDTTNVLNDSDIEITDIEETSPGVWTVTLGETVTATATGDFLTRHGSRGKEKTGFEQILNISGDWDELYNITHSIWTGNIDSTGGALSEGRMIAMVDTIRRRGGKTTVMFASLGVRRAYFNLLVQQRRYNDTVEFEGGFKGLKFATDNGDIPLISDFDCPPGHLWFMNEKQLKLYQAGDWGFMNRDGSMWYRVSDTDGRKDAYGADLYKYCELGTHQRNSHGVMTDLTEAS
jgi:hypothetical protein